ncbi:MAG TPA: polysaccharide deacetylase family protein [Armatimonadota bacterium]|nr:polysaccharide deacetylase family protein [Armatimonadota bacterium]HOM81060.1 polysaccharide deacetylase family protein [Armatimonadota bacterium]HPO72202.1 polysaccharide deacetylase family protein [Armatimonadota bacterium]HPT97107.1 polysaccharide deacetylase family protein [Armatimonadota bacterium]
MTRVIFAYDLENAELCVQAAPVLARLHEEHQVPATFFCLGRVLEQKGAQLKPILGRSPLFDLQSHTYAHRMLRDNAMHGPGVSLDVLREEITLGKEWVERVFERPCIGTRSGCGFFQGMRGAPDRLAIFAECGVRYISTYLRGPADSIPSGLQQAHWYTEDGFPNLLELPGHGWHDNVLKGPRSSMLCLSWPPVLSWGIPNRPVRDPEEELAVQRVWYERAFSLGLDYISLVYHPHSVYRQSPDCQIIDLLIRLVKSMGLPTTTYTDLYREYAAAPEKVPGLDAWRWDDELDNGPLRLPQSLERRGGERVS